MVKLPRLAVYALMTPALTLGIHSAFATDTPAELAGDDKQQRTTQEQRDIREQRRTPGVTGSASMDRAQQQRMAEARAQQRDNAEGIYLSSAPDNALSADKLIGTKLKSQSDDETIGSISDLLIDENGEIAAVVVEAGEFLGMGKKNVAVSWDAVQRSSSEESDDYDLSVDTSKDELEDAPEYKAEANTPY